LIQYKEGTEEQNSTVVWVMCSPYMSTLNFHRHSLHLATCPKPFCIAVMTT